MLVGELIVMLVACTLPKYTLVRPGIKPLPTIFICAPSAPEVGVKESITGSGYKKLKPVFENPEPMGLTIVNWPLRPLPATATIVSSETIVKEVANSPPKYTCDALLK